MQRRSILWGSLFFLLSTQVLYGWTLNNLKWADVSSDFEINKNEFSGNWKKKDSWKGVVCNGAYYYGFHIDGKVNKPKLQMQPDKSLLITATLQEISGSVYGGYRSEYSACLPIRSRLGAYVDWLDIQSTVKLLNNGTDKPVVQLHVLKTQFGPIHFSDWLPRWFEDLLTSLVNQAAVEIWHSNVGQWISDKIAEELNNHAPQNTIQ